MYSATSIDPVVGVYIDSVAVDYVLVKIEHRLNLPSLVLINDNDTAGKRFDSVPHELAYHSIPYYKENFSLGFRRKGWWIDRFLTVIL